MIGYTGLTPKVEQSGDSDRRGPLRKNGPNHLRWALVEAAHTASRHALYQPTAERNRARHGRKRGSTLAALTIARKLTEAIWHMLTNDQPSAPAGARNLSGRIDGPKLNCATGATPIHSSPETVQ